MSRCTKPLLLRRTKSACDLRGNLQRHQHRNGAFSLYESFDRLTIDKLHRVEIVAIFPSEMGETVATLGCLTRRRPGLAQEPLPGRLTV